MTKNGSNCLRIYDITSKYVNVLLWPKNKCILLQKARPLLCKYVIPLLEVVMYH